MNIKIAALALLLGFGAGWYADVAESSRKQSADISAGQQAIIARQSFEFHRYNEIARNANQYAINIKGQSDEKQIVYRTIIKRDPASGKCVPDDVANRLLDYTNRLRAGAMHPTAGDTDTTGTGSAASGCRLTYAQAVYWIDPLLAAIEQANGKLAAIRDAEQARASSGITKVPQ
ncbi:hypothetical protein [Dickeya fangzhongdai]|uniref:hypothetical protein n=1 Tax=Dickeya fangzhongdai TaxID=1778540 RepID=UPI0023E38A2C|nr:hypothetical protein [Dickeya fangzhongdai]WES88790.1 hypothetical protein PQ617_21720 [Dickeya fangzhongdai]